MKKLNIKNKKLLNENLIIFLYEFLFVISYIILQSILPNCPAKILFNIPCPFCNGRHAINELLKLNFISSLKYNIIILPIVIYLMIFNILLILECITGKRIAKTKNINKKIIVLVIILLLVISEIYNLINL